MVLDVARGIGSASCRCCHLVEHVHVCCPGDHDDRVVPLHTHKLLATLQHVLAGSKGAQQSNPLLARYEVRAGHGAGKPTDKVIAETADCFGFAAAVTSSQWTA